MGLKRKETAFFKISFFKKRDFTIFRRETGLALIFTSTAGIDKNDKKYNII